MRIVTILDQQNVLYGYIQDPVEFYDFVCNYSNGKCNTKLQKRKIYHPVDRDYIAKYNRLEAFSRTCDSEDAGYLSTAHSEFSADILICDRNVYRLCVNEVWNSIAQSYQ